MFERFTERARQVVVFAQDETRGLGHNHIGTEHLLVGLLREEEGLAARVLQSLDVDPDHVRTRIVEIAFPRTPSLSRSAEGPVLQKNRPMR